MDIQQQSGADANLRFYLRDLKTGEERYLGDAKQIGELLTRGLRAENVTQPRQEETA